MARWYKNRIKETRYNWQKRLKKMKRGRNDERNLDINEEEHKQLHEYLRKLYLIKGI